MATIFRARRTAETGVGGKIVRGRRVTTAVSPYFRPKTRSTRSESPNWLVGLVSPAARMIANGAGKVSSFFFGSDSSPSSSSGSDASLDDDTDVDVDVDDDDDVDVDVNSSQGVEELNETGMISQAIKHPQKEPQPIVQKTDAKLVVERLLMQETFSRDECDRLTKIIQSRVLDSSTMKEGHISRQNELPDRTVGSIIASPRTLLLHQTRNSPAAYPYSFNYLSPEISTSGKHRPDFCQTAIMEAKKWLKEKKSESSSKSELDYGTCTLNTVMLPNVTEDEAGSPVDVAKSYMQARPPWTSPSLGQIHYQTPSPTGKHLFKEETPYESGGYSSSKLLKRNSLAIGSWNLIDEIRRVRFKATEDILERLPSKQTDSSAMVEAGKIDAEVSGLVHDSSSSPASKPVGAASLPASDGSPENFKQGPSLSASLVSDSMHDGPGKKAECCSLTIVVSGNHQDPPSTRGVGIASVSCESPVPDSSSVQRNGPLDFSAEILNRGPQVNSIDDMNPLLPSGLHDAHDSTQLQSSSVGERVELHQLSHQKEVHYGSLDGNPLAENQANGLRNGVTSNGFPSLASSSSAEPNANLITSKSGKLIDGISKEGTCELLSESSIDALVIEKTDNIASGALNSLSEKEDGDKSGKKVEKPQGKKTGRYSRRGRGRGK